MRYFFVYLVLMVLMAALIGCFESRPPVGATGELVGCVTAGDDLYCTTKYAGAGAENTTPVLIGVIRFEKNLKNFHLDISFTDENGENERVHRVILVESLRPEPTTGYKGPGRFENWYFRIVSGDTVAVAIVNPPTIFLPHQGYIIANLTRPDVEFEIPEEVGDVDILDLIP